MKKFQLFALLLIIFSTVAFGQTESIYTSLSAKSCKALEQEDGYRGVCPGVGGYKLELLEGDLRQTINVITPNGTKSELELWTAVSSGFSSVSGKAEWRITGKGKSVKPDSLILRFNASENPDDSTKITSYLVVVKIDGNAACISEIIKPMSNQNEKAREAADNSAGQPCKSME
jgi:hypothetical protein